MTSKLSLRDALEIAEQASTRSVAICQRSLTGQRRALTAGPGVTLLAVIAILPRDIVAEASPIVGRWPTNDSAKHATKRSDVTVSAIQRDVCPRFRENSSSSRALLTE